jgi:hypothetical protein
MRQVAGQREHQRNKQDDADRALFCLGYLGINPRAANRNDSGELLPVMVFIARHWNWTEGARPLMISICSQGAAVKSPPSHQWLNEH